MTEEQIKALAEGANPYSPVTGEDNENGGAGDGMDDGWEVARGLDPTINDSAEDPDNDGLTNLEEWNGGDSSTDPKDDDSDDDGLPDGDEVNIHSTNPNNPDSDADGLDDAAELAASTDPNDPDSDMDEMFDGFEVDNGFDPLLASDAALDADNDGSLNLEEFQRGTNPKVQDTDMDGLFDGVESGTGTFVSVTNTGTDPLNPDSDDDGLNDGDELTAGTDPFNPDTDGDTVPDGLDDDPLSGGKGLEFGLVSYWAFESDLMDSVDDNHGTEDGGTIPFEPGKFGEAISLNGSQNVIISGGDESEFDFAGGSMSVSVWCTAATIDKSWQCLIAKGEGNGWRVHRRGEDNPPEFSFTGGNGDTPAHGTPIMIGTDPETWHHVVAVTDGLTGIETLYLDGIEVSSLGGAVLEDRANRMRIGENPDATGRGWNGKIDDVAIWARALSAEEIASIWANGDGASIEVLLGGGIQLEITDITYDNNGTENRGDDTISLTWPSKEGQSFKVYSTEDLGEWVNELDDAYPADVGDSTTYTFPATRIANPVPGKAFFRVQK